MCPTLFPQSLFLEDIETAPTTPWRPYSTYRNIRESTRPGSFINFLQLFKYIRGHNPKESDVVGNPFHCSLLCLPRTIAITRSTYADRPFGRRCRVARLSKRLHRSRRPLLHIIIETPLKLKSCTTAFGYRIDFS